MEAKRKPGRPPKVKPEEKLPSSTDKTVVAELELPMQGFHKEIITQDDLVETKNAASPDMMAMFLAALQQMSADNRETTLAAIAEMKKPSPEEQAKADADKAALMEQVTRRVDAAKAQDAELAERRSNCAHVMPNGQTNFRGQVLSNGWAGVFCSYCWDAYTFEATETERNQSGLNVDKWGPNAFTIIKSRAAKCKDLTPPPVPKVPAGATIIFG